jgi:excisionase family DNA binding protein
MQEYKSKTDKADAKGLPPDALDLAHRLTLKIDEAAKMLGVSQTSVRRLIQRGHLKPLRHFRHVLIPVVQLKRMIEEASIEEVPRSLKMKRKGRGKGADGIMTHIHANEASSI